MREGAIYQKELDDGREMTVYPMLFNDRICIGPPDEPYYEDGWCIVRGYGVDVAKRWDGKGEPPGPWIKQVGTDKRGPGTSYFEEAER